MLSLDRVQEVGEGEGGVVRARGQRAAPKHGCGSGGATGHPPQRWERSGHGCRHPRVPWGKSPHRTSADTEKKQVSLFTRLPA